MMSECCTVGERTGIKRSVIGPHCVIGGGVKISNCIIMNHVRIEDGSVVYLKSTFQFNQHFTFYLQEYAVRVCDMS
jgi:NDP-sugar pyrophosphorylase family protein